MTTSTQTPANQTTTQPQSVSSAEAFKNSATLEIQSDLYKHGHEAARKSGLTEVDEEVLKTLEEHARAMARQTSQGQYDPKKNAHDALREEKYRKLLKEQDKLEQAAAHAEKEQNKRADELADLEYQGNEPKVPLYAKLVSTLVMALSLAPSFHDFLFSPLEDDLLNWALSMLAGACIGAFIVWSILGVVDSSGTRNKANLFGLLSGIVLVSGFALLRFSGAETTGEYLYTIALVVVEAGAVLLTEGAAIVFRQRYVRWFAKSEAYLMGQARLSAAQKQLSDIKQKISQGHGKIQAHENYVEDRMRRFLGVGALEEAAAASTRDGYLSGLTDNRGKLFGTQE